eukprot:TRINITY_DN6855_c1_g3_i1.p1 TRINITY_DN6855_c1_g3~~TRINITY_DN6855_c1_g3_i1.p1  ORF type:complete len:2055 (+),score=547.80 TRINITY_DN6855_c1_g3_i1:180-6344(+)
MYDMQSHEELALQNRKLQAQLNRMRLGKLDVLSDVTSDGGMESAFHAGTGVHEQRLLHIKKMLCETRVARDGRDFAQAEMDEAVDWVTQNEARNRDWEEERQSLAFSRLKRLEELVMQWHTLCAEEEYQRAGILGIEDGEMRHAELSYTYESAYLHDKLDRDMAAERRFVEDGEGEIRRALSTQHQLELARSECDERVERVGVLCWEGVDRIVLDEILPLEETDLRLLVEMDCVHELEYLRSLYHSEGKDYLVQYMKLHEKVRLRRIEDDETLGRCVMHSCEDAGFGTVAQLYTAATAEARCRDSIMEEEIEGFARVVTVHDAECLSILTFHDAAAAARDAYDRAVSAVMEEELMGREYFQQGRFLLMLSYTVDQERAQRLWIESAEHGSQWPEEPDVLAPSTVAAGDCGDCVYTEPTEPLSPPRARSVPTSDALRSPAPVLSEYMSYEGGVSRAVASQRQQGCRARYTLERHWLRLHVQRDEARTRERLCREEEEEFPVTGLRGPGGRVSQLLDLERLARADAVCFEDVSRRLLEVAHHQEESLQDRESHSRHLLCADQLLRREEIERSTLDSGHAIIQQQRAFVSAWALDRVRQESYPLRLLTDVILPDEWEERQQARTWGLCRQAFSAMRLTETQEEDGRYRVEVMMRGYVGALRLLGRSELTRLREVYSTLRAFAKKRKESRVLAERLCGAFDVCTRQRAYRCLLEYLKSQRWRRARMANASALLRVSDVGVRRGAYQSWRGYVLSQKQSKRVSGAADALCRQSRLYMLRLCYRRLERFRDRGVAGAREAARRERVAEMVLQCTQRGVLLLRWRVLLRYHAEVTKLRVRQRAADALCGHLQDAGRTHLMRRAYRRLSLYSSTRLQRRQEQRAEWRVAEAFLKQTQTGAVRRIFLNWLAMHRKCTRQRRVHAHLEEAAYAVLSSCNKAVQRRAYARWLRWLSLAWRRGLRAKRAAARQMLRRVETETLRRCFRRQLLYAKTSVQQRECARRNSLVAEGLRGRSRNVLRFVYWRKWSWFVREYARRRRVAALVSSTSVTCIRRYRFSVWLRYLAYRKHSKRRSFLAYTFGQHTERSQLRERWRLWATFASRAAQRRRLAQMLAVGGGKAQLQLRFSALRRYAAASRRARHRSATAGAVSITCNRTHLASRFVQWCRVAESRLRFKRMAAAVQGGSATGIRRFRWDKLRRFTALRMAMKRRSGAADALYYTSNVLLLRRQMSRWARWVSLRRRRTRMMWLLLQRSTGCLLRPFFTTLLRFVAFERRRQRRKVLASALARSCNLATLRWCWHRLLPRQPAEGMSRRRAVEGGRSADWLLRSTKLRLQQRHWWKLLRCATERAHCRNASESRSRELSLSSELSRSQARQFDMTEEMKVVKDRHVEDREERYKAGQRNARVRRRAVIVQVLSGMCYYRSRRAAWNRLSACVGRKRSAAHGKDAARQWAVDAEAECRRAVQDAASVLSTLRQLRPELGEVVSRRQLADYEAETRAGLVRYLLGGTMRGAFNRLDHGEWCTRTRLEGCGMHMLFLMFSHFEGEAELYNRRAIEHREAAERLHAPRLAIRKLVASVGTEGQPRSPAVVERVVEVPDGRAALLEQQIHLLRVQLAESEGRRNLESSEDEYRARCEDLRRRYRPAQATPREVGTGERSVLDHEEGGRDSIERDEESTRAALTSFEADSRIHHAAEVQRLEQGEAEDRNDIAFDERDIRSAVLPDYAPPYTPPAAQQRSAPPPAAAAAAEHSSSGKAKRPYLGMDLIDGTVHLRDGKTLDYIDSGCKVRQMKAGPARDAGIQTGDLIMKVNMLGTESPVKSMEEWRALASKMHPGMRIEIGYRRQGAKLQWARLNVASAAQYGKTEEWGQGRSYRTNITFKGSERGALGLQEELSPEAAQQVELLREVFDAADADGSGALSMRELEHVLRTDTRAQRIFRLQGVGDGPTTFWAERLMQKMDSDGDRALTWQELEAHAQELLLSIAPGASSPQTRRSSASAAAAAAPAPQNRRPSAARHGYDSHALQRGRAVTEGTRGMYGGLASPSDNSGPRGARHTGSSGR